MNKESLRYNGHEVSRIIRRALEAKQEETISHKELLEIGKELGLGEDEIQAAVVGDKKQQKVESQIRRRKVGLQYHFYSYIGVNSLLLAINILTPGPWWFQWSAFGWGIGLFCHYRAIFKAERRIRSKVSIERNTMNNSTQEMS